MLFSDEDLAVFHRQEGFLLQPAVLTLPDLSAIEEGVTVLSERDAPSRVMEQDGGFTIRALHGCHLGNPLFERFVRRPIS